jgi:predicted AAA+ superfamily ATPase
MRQNRTILLFIDVLVKGQLRRKPLIAGLRRYAIKDNYPKFVVTMDDFGSDNVDGVKHKNLEEFLLMDEY